MVIRVNPGHATGNPGSWESHTGSQESHTGSREFHTGSALLLAVQNPSEPVIT